MNSKIETIRGRPIPLRGHDIDTDRIIPARYLKRVSFEGIEEGVFEDDRKQLEARGGRHPFSDPRYQGASVLIVNRNFGCGSSREHAPQAIQRWGIKAILGESYSDIFFGNSVALGLPCLTLSPADIDALMAEAEAHPERELTIDLSRMEVTAGDQAGLKGDQAGLKTRLYKTTMPASAREALITGTWDGTGLLLDDIEQIKAVATGLPYVKGF